MAAPMVSLMKWSLSFWLRGWLLLFPAAILAMAPAASPACVSSSCVTTGEKNNDSAIGQYSRGLGEDLLNTNLGLSHRPNLDSLSLRASRRGLKAELIRYHHHDPSSQATNSSEISMAIKRSLARGRILKTKKTPKASVKGASGGKSYNQDPQPLGLHSDLTSGAPFEYLMKISIGSPAQHLMAVADTGSDLVWLQCTPPPRLGQQQQQPQTLLDNKHFDPSNSTTFFKLACNSKPCHLLSLQYKNWISCSGSSRCHYSYFYADNSSSTGDLAVDTLHMKSTSLGSSMGGELLASASVHNFAFGCGHKQYSTSMLYVNANGIVGLGKGPLSFPSQLGAQFGRKFSYCLVDRERSTVKSSPILFGRFAVPTTPGVQYTPFLDNPVYPTYYYIGLERIDVGEEALDVPSSAFELSFGAGGGEGGTVIDSGTTFSQLVAPAYTALLQALSTRIKYERVAGYFDFCHDVTDIKRSLVVVPPISFHFRGGAKMDLPFKNAFILVPNDPVPGKTTMCLAMNNSTDLGFTIIGNYQQTNHHIVFDLQEKRLGFVPRQCG